MSNNNQTIIVKRIKKVAGGHHGGAWKVAYADFVTAMMAFFLLLWLLNATEAENLAGLADYFAPTVGVKDEIGIGFRGGKAALSEGIGADKNTNKGVVFGGVPTGPITKVTTKIEERTEREPDEKIQVMINEVNTDKKGSEDADDNQNNPSVVAATAEKTAEATNEEMQKTEQAIQNTVNDMVKDRRIEDGSVEIKRTPEGLLIEIKDLTGNSMFEDDTAVMKDKLKKSLVEISKILKNLSNTFALVGHTSSTPINTKIPGYTKWELSADRANVTRNFLTNNGVNLEQFSRIEGRADNIPYDKRKPESNVNNRINIIILSKNDTPNHKRNAPESILIDTNSKQTKDFLNATENKQKEEDEKKKENENKQQINNNIDVKGILNETANTQKEAEKLKPEDKDKFINNEVIDLKIDKKEEIKKPVEQKIKDNSSFQNILNEAEKIQQPKPAEVKKIQQPTNNLINLDVDRTKVNEVIDNSTKSTPANSGFQQILQEAEKTKAEAAKSANKPVSP